MRMLSNRGTKPALKLVGRLRFQRRLGEICFFLSIPCFAMSAGCLSFIKAGEMVGNSKVGWCCLVIQCFFGVIIMSIIISSEFSKKRAEKGDTQEYDKQVKSQYK